VFAVKLDESTDASGKRQVLAFVGFEENSDITEQFLFCRDLTTITNGREIFDYFEENEIQWAHCISVCTDGAPALTGRIKDFLAFVKKLNPTSMTTHCFLHGEALMMKNVDGGQLVEVLSTVVSMINYIKTRPVKSRIFEQLCEAMGAEHTTLLLHTEIRWLSRGKALRRLAELQDQLLLFFEDEKPE
jgi:hypothetical protein